LLYRPRVRLAEIVGRMTWQQQAFAWKLALSTALHHEIGASSAEAAA